jgi:hypothetical protein
VLATLVIDLFFAKNGEGTSRERDKKRQETRLEMIALQDKDKDKCKGGKRHRQDNETRQDKLPKGRKTEK